MATTITNQATLVYQYDGNSGSAASNIATATMQGPMSVAKVSLDTEYRAGDEITYNFHLLNSGSSPMTNIVIVDDLGTFSIPGPVSVTPLTYIGPAWLYIDGLFNSVLTPVVTASSVTFTIPLLAAGSNALLLYKVMINNKAPLAVNSTITNEITATADGLSEPVTDSYTITVEEYANISILKSISPNPLVDGGTVTYSFIIYNFGNTDASDVVMSDTFTLAPASIVVTVGGSIIPDTQYDYIAGVLTLPNAGGGLSLTVAAATFTRNDSTGVIAINPGMMEITVSGTI